MHVLFLSRWLPYPADNGSKIRVLNLVKTLAARHAVSLFAFTSENAATQRAATAVLGEICARLTLVPYRPFRPTSTTALRGLFSPSPRFLVDTYSTEMARLVRATISAQPVDLVIASEIDMAPYATLAPAPALLEELEITRYLDALHTGPLPARLRASLTWLKLRAYLRRTLPRFAACTVVSERERDLVRAAAPTYDRVTVIPNAVDLDRYTGDFGQPAPDTLIHTGALTYRPNLDAVGYFLQAILPAIQARRPAVQVRVTGQAPAAALATLPPATDVEWTGYLDDIRPAIAQSWLSIVPLRLGGGTRLKILEALALGTPVVTTPKGAEGLALVDGEEVLIGATPNEFAQAAVAVLESPALRDRLAAAGRRRVAADYSWQRVGQELHQLIDRLPPEASAAVEPLDHGQGSRTAGGRGKA